MNLEQDNTDKLTVVFFLEKRRICTDGLKFPVRKILEQATP